MDNTGGAVDENSHAAACMIFQVLSQLALDCCDESANLSFSSNSCALAKASSEAAAASTGASEPCLAGGGATLSEFRDAAGRAAWEEDDGDEVLGGLSTIGGGAECSARIAATPRGSDASAPPLRTPARRLL